MENFKEKENNIKLENWEKIVFPIFAAIIIISPCILAFSILWIIGNQDEEFAGGKGTIYNPYQIEYSKQLNNIRKHLNKYFVLNGNINASRIKNFKPIGDKHTPFKGFLDGRGYSIRNLQINRPDEDNVGLFGVIINRASIENICLENVNIKGNSNVGGLVGHVKNSDIKNICVTGNIRGNLAVGGIIGINKGRLYNSYTDVNILKYDNTESFLVGGLVGINNSSDNYETIISNSYSMGEIEGSRLIGGLVGRNESKINSNYSIMKVNGNDKIGGFVSQNQGIIIGKNYWLGSNYLKGIDKKLKGSYGNNNVFKNTSEQIKNLNYSSTGWDRKKWIFKEQKYPRLFWQKEKNKSSDDGGDGGFFFPFLLFYAFTR